MTTTGQTWPQGGSLDEVTADSLYVNIGGDTLTGPLTINTAATQLLINGTTATNREIAFNTASVQRWTLRANSTAEGGSNAGSDFQIIPKDDGGTSLGSALTITRSSGLTTMKSAAIDPGTGSATLLIKSSSGVSGSLAFTTGGGTWRWRFAKNATTEGGTNSGSDFYIEAFNDAGASLGTALAITRSTQLATVKGDPTDSLGIVTKQYADAYLSGVGVSQPVGNPLLPTNAILESVSRYSAAITNQAAFTTGVGRIYPIGILRAGQAATGIGFMVATTAASAITNSWGGICTADRVVRAVSATSTAAPGSNTVKTFTFGSSYTPSVDTFVYGFLMFAGTTMPTAYGYAATNAALFGSGIGTVVSGTYGSGLTTPPAVSSTLAAPAASTIIPYLWLTG